MRIVFMGTGDIALPSFSALLASEHDVVALYTQPDKPVGRKQILTPPKVKVMAEKNGVCTFQPERVGCELSISTLSELSPDVIVVMAYGQILPQALIDLPKIAIINLHASLLPKYRGAACIQAAIDSGDEETGMTVMHVVKQLDAGDMICRSLLPLSSQSTGGEVHDQLAAIGPDVLLKALDELEHGRAKGVPQDDAVSTYAPKLLRDHGRIDWSVSADAIERRIRAYHPWPGTYTTYFDAKNKERRLKVFPQTEVVILDAGVEHAPGEVLDTTDGLLVCCGRDALRVYMVQPDGRKKMEANIFLGAGKLKQGDILGVKL